MGARVLLLDLDRTLIDLQSFTDYQAALDDAQVIAGDQARAQVPQTDWDSPTQACMTMLNALAGDPRWAQVSAVIEGHERKAIPRATIMPTVVDALPTLRRRQVCVVTLLPAPVSTEVLIACGIDVGPGLAIDHVIGRDSRMRPKPHPDGLLAACELLQATPHEAVMIGDSTWDRDAAKAAGIEFIGVPVQQGALGLGTRVAASFAEAVAMACD